MRSSSPGITNSLSRSMWGSNPNPVSLNLEIFEAQFSSYPGMTDLWSRSYIIKSWDLWRPILSCLKLLHIVGAPRVQSSTKSQDTQQDAAIIPYRSLMLLDAENRGLDLITKIKNLAHWYAEAVIPSNMPQSYHSFMLLDAENRAIDFMTKMESLAHWFT